MPTGRLFQAVQHRPVDPFGGQDHMDTGREFPAGFFDGVHGFGNDFAASLVFLVAALNDERCGVCQQGAAVPEQSREDDDLHRAGGVLHGQKGHALALLVLVFLDGADQATDAHRLALGPGGEPGQVGIHHLLQFPTEVVQGMAGDIEPHGFLLIGKFFLFLPFRQVGQFDVRGALGRLGQGGEQRDLAALAVPLRGLGSAHGLVENGEEL